MRPALSMRERLEQRSVPEPNTGCWLWLGALHSTGYAPIAIGKKQYLAHRMAYEEFVGPIPAGLHIDHLCRVRSCINPAHLEPVTRVENVMRGFSPHAINKRKTHCKRGHSLSEDVVYRWQGKATRGCRPCRSATANAHKKRKRLRDAASLMATGEQRAALEAELAPLNASAERLYRVLDGREVADA